MAQFTTGGRFKCLFSGDGLSVGFDVFHQRPIWRDLKFTYLPSVLDGDRRRNRKRKLGFFSGVAVHAATPSSSRRTNESDGVFDDVLEDDDADLEIDELSGFRGLVLDISYRPVNVVCWRRAICLEFMDKADVLEYYDQTVNSPSGSFYIPAVLRVPHLLQVVKRRRVRKGLSHIVLLVRT